MQFTIENIAGGNHVTFRALTTAAKYIATHEVFGGYRIVNDKVTPDSEYDNALAVVTYAGSATKECKKGDWNSVVDTCIAWFDMPHEDDE